MVRYSSVGFFIPWWCEVEFNDLLNFWRKKPAHGIVLFLLSLWINVLSALLSLADAIVYSLLSLCCMLSFVIGTYGAIVFGDLCSSAVSNSSFTMCRFVHQLNSYVQLKAALIIKKQILSFLEEDFGRETPFPLIYFCFVQRGYLVCWLIKRRFVV